MGSDDDRDDDAKRSRSRLPGLPPRPPRPAGKPAAPSEDAPPARSSSPLPSAPSPDSLFRAPLDPPYGASFDWSPTYLPADPSRPPPSRRRASKRFPSSRRRESAPPAPATPSPSPGSPPNLWGLLVLGVMKLFVAGRSWWRLFLLLPFALTGWACWYLGRQLPDGLSSTLPLIALSMTPASLVALAHVLGRLARRSPTASPATASLPRSADAWLRDRLGRASMIAVARPPSNVRVNAYLPKRHTILLSEDIIGQATAGAYAVAAHELGHALLHRRAPRVAAALLWCRQQTAPAFGAGTLLLWAAVLTGEPRWIWLAPLAFLVAVLLQLAVILDEALASVVAMRELHRAGLDRAQRRVARRTLATAFFTYAASAVAYLLPLLLWPQLSQHVAGLRELSDLARPVVAPLSAFSSALTFAAAAFSLAGLLGILVELFVYLPRQREVLVTKLLAVSALLLSPFLFLFLAHQPLGRAFPWPLLLAFIPARRLISLPLSLLFALLLGRLPTLQPERPRFPSAPPASIPIVSTDELHPAGSWRRTCTRVLFVLAATAPLASLYLLDLVVALTGR